MTALPTAAAKVLCPSCRHPKRRHSAMGCTAANHECICDLTPEQIGSLPPAKELERVPDRADLAAASVALDEQIAVVDQALAVVDAILPSAEPTTPAATSPSTTPRPARPRRTPRTQMPKVAPQPSPIAGERLDWWDAFVCLKCRGRYFLPNDCCGQTTLPVTVTVTVREVSR